MPKNKNFLTFSAIALLGFSSGLPLMLVSSTLQAWFTQTGKSLVTIGALSIIGLPYLLKFFWAPLFDYVRPFGWGRRRGWLAILQILLISTIALCALGQPQHNPLFLISITFVIAALSASQDVVINALQTEVVQTDEQGVSAACYVVGYRVAMLISGGMALVMADSLGFPLTYLFMGSLMLIGLFANYFIAEPKEDAVYENLELAKQNVPKMIWQRYWLPFQEIFQRDSALWICLFVLCFKTSNSLSLIMTPTFLLREVGFSLTSVGLVMKAFGLVMTLIGVFIGGFSLKRYALGTSLLLTGLLEALSNLLYAALLWVGKSMPILIWSVSLENLFTGMETAIFLAFLMNLCNKRYTASQLALLSALSSFPRILLGPVAGIIVEHFNWLIFYGFTIVCYLPALLLGIIGISYGFLPNIRPGDREHNVSVPNLSPSHLPE